MVHASVYYWKGIGISYSEGVTHWSHICQLGKVAHTCSPGRDGRVAASLRPAGTTQQNPNHTSKATNRTFSNQWTPGPPLQSDGKLFYRGPRARATRVDLCEHAYSKISSSTVTPQSPWRAWGSQGYSLEWVSLFSPSKTSSADYSDSLDWEPAR